MTQLKHGTSVASDPACAHHASLKALYAYWLEKRGSRCMPLRSDLVASQIKEHLGWISLIDVLPGAEDFRYRLVGTRIANYFSSDSSGETVGKTFAIIPEARDVMLALLRQVVATKTPIRTYGDLKWLGRDLEEFESLFLPFSDDGDAVGMIMNPFTFDRSTVYLNRQIQSAR